MKKIISITMEDGTIYNAPTLSNDSSIFTNGFVVLDNYYGDGILTYVNECLIKEINVEEGE